MSVRNKHDQTRKSVLGFPLTLTSCKISAKQIVLEGETEGRRQKFKDRSFKNRMLDINLGLPLKT
jgi:hypothetical protein